MKIIKRRRPFCQSSTFYRRYKTLMAKASKREGEELNHSGMMKPTSNEECNISENDPYSTVWLEENVDDNAICEDDNNDNDDDESDNNDDAKSDNSDDANIENTNKNVTFVDNLKNWALANQIKHSALNSLLSILREDGKFFLPRDSRTLLQTPSSVSIMKMSSGEYWYNGLQNCLIKILERNYVVDGSVMIDFPTTLKLTFNIDGLPVYKSSKKQFWPILFRVDNIPDSTPMPIAIYYGESKPPLEDYLTPFVDELKKILENGLKILGKIVVIRISSFICDSPARSFIKGTVNFNSYHGCMKCDTLGKYYNKSFLMSFSNTNATLRTDWDFRNRTDAGHHKTLSPLEKLPIDMVSDFIVADSLHLIDLGVFKKLLLTWMNGKSYKCKWSALEIKKINEKLNLCNCFIPSEIHRSVRKLDCLSFWKGTEFRTFLLYLGPPLLKEHLPVHVYQNFLTLFCATIICSTKAYTKYLNIAQKLFENFIEHYIEIYGEDKIGSNVHNLCHVVDDVKRFGPLPLISAYPFENSLFQIKSYLRSGYRALAQTAKRIHELSKMNNNKNIQVIYPFCKNKFNHCNTSDSPKYKKIFINKEFMLSSTNKNKWFLSQQNDIVEFMSAKFVNEEWKIKGKSFQDKHDFFDLPFKSSRLNIYAVYSKKETVNISMFTVKEIKCKMLALPCQNETVFIPLLHTLDA